MPCVEHFKGCEEVLGRENNLVPICISLRWAGGIYTSKDLVSN